MLVVVVVVKCWPLLLVFKLLLVDWYCDLRFVLACCLLFVCLVLLLVFIRFRVFVCSCCYVLSFVVAVVCRGLCYSSLQFVVCSSLAFVVVRCLWLVVSGCVLFVAC